MALTEIRQKWFILQENSQAGTGIKAGPFFDEESATNACKSAALAAPGVAFSVAKVVTGFSTGDAPLNKLKFTQVAGDPTP